MHKDTVAVIGLGHTGLPMALAYAEAGHDVISYDTNRKLISNLNNGVSHIADVNPGRLARNNITYTHHPDHMMDATVFIVCVPTPLNYRHEADLSHVVSAMADVNDNVVDGAVVILQSTVPVGTTREMRGLIQADVVMGYSPERINPGSTMWGIRNTPRLYSSLDNARGYVNMIKDALSPVCIELRPAESCEVAEMSKLWENTFRAVNIAVATELSNIADSYGLNVTEVLDAAATKPYGFMRFNPGAGVGGDCIPTDSWMLVEKLLDGSPDDSTIITALQTNDRRPWDIIHSARSFINASGKGPIEKARILVLGVSYKPGVNDTRNSPGVRIMRGLMELGATVDYCDPIISNLVIDGEPMTRVKWSSARHGYYDLIIMANADAEWLGSPEGFTQGDVVLDPHGILRGRNILGVN